MEPYDAVLEADCFAEATSTFNWLIGQLIAPETASWTHDRLEEMLQAGGRELLRRLLQGRLDLCALRERQLLARSRGCGMTGPDQVVRRRVETGHC